MSSPIIIALDFKSAQEVEAFVEPLEPKDCRLKVGKELFVSTGPGLVKNLVHRGFDVFLDLKFHDIPNTVAQACLAAADLGVWMMNVHASGGERMMSTAMQALAARGYNGMLIGVTVLTSMSEAELGSLGIGGSLPDQVMRLAGLVNNAGLAGVVCSAQEAASLKARFGKDFVLVTPGIRPAGDALGDQSRVVTPAQAMENGSDYLVIGRPITQSLDPKGKLGQIHEELRK